jgi:opacity protein-like surface antigen
MITRDAFLAPLWPARPRASVSPLRVAEQAAAAAAMGLLIMASAMPSDSAPPGAAVSSNPPVSTARNPGRESDFGAYLGAPYHNPSDFHLVKPGVHDLTIKNVHWYTLPFKNPLYYGVRIQRWLEGGRLGAMLDFTHSKVHAPLKKEATFEGSLNGKPVPAKAKIGDYFDKLEWTHGHNMLTLNGLVRLATFGIISPYAGLGVGVSLPHAEIHLKTDAHRTYEYQYTGPAAQALFGVEFRLAKGSLFIEYKFTASDYWGPLTGRDGAILPIDLWRQFSRWWTGEPPPDGWAGAKLVSHQVIGGFLVRFVPQTAATQ